MSAQIRKPTDRTCTDCGRAEQWDEDAGNWRVRDDDVGNVHCIHDWDITGTFVPVEE